MRKILKFARRVKMARYDNLGRNHNKQDYIKNDNNNYIETDIVAFDSKIDANMSAEIEVEMAETIYDMRREFKRQNKMIRKLYSNKEPKKSFYESHGSSKSQRLSKRHATA